MWNKAARKGRCPKLHQSPPLTEEKLLIIKCYIWHVVSSGFLIFCPFTLILWDKMWCGPATLGSSCCRASIPRRSSSWRCWHRPSGGKAVVTSGDTCSSRTNRLALPSPNSSTILLPELHVLPGHGLILSALHSVTSSLVALICQNLSLLWARPLVRPSPREKPRCVLGLRR